MQTHRIQRILIETNASTEAEARSRQDDGFEACESVFTSSIQTILDEISSPHRITRIDRLEIDLKLEGDQPWDSLGDSFQFALRSALREKGIYPGRPEASDEWEISPKQTRSEWLKAFLLTGALPWWKEPPSSDVFEYELLAWLRDDSDAADWIRIQAARHSELVQRLTLQLSETTLIETLALLARTSASSQALRLLANLAGTSSRILSELKRSFRSPEALRQLLRAWPAPSQEAERLANFIVTALRNLPDEAVLSGLPILAGSWGALLEAMPNAVAKPLATRILEAVTLHFGDALTQALHPHVETTANAFLPNALPPASTLKLVRRILSLLSPELRSDHPNTPQPSIDPRRLDSTTRLDAESAHPSPALDSPSTDDHDSPASNAATYYLENCGLVLFAPYLDRFFQNCGITLSPEPAGRVLAERAPLLLQYLADHETEFPEYLLPLNKLLCGFPLNESLPRDLKIQPSEQAAASKLISAVIKNWARIGDVSIPSFQKSFLQRRGILSETEFDWELRVEREPYDMLLDTVPWTFRSIRLSWMPKPLRVEW